ncbi:AraC family transcriptional regulator [Variovorax sp. PDNC026]|uniref:AraC family transcriptional regulator n=1 Tax=Variovorax sp. PDNC026 TaxID=2811425 RepID=UPI001F05F542|nr:AraC family transcriptional regulator [Variovorax sp. PDNC026]
MDRPRVHLKGGGDGLALRYLRLLLAPAQARGCDTEELLRRCHLTPAQLDNPSHVVTLVQFARALRGMQRALRDEMMGLATRPVRVGTFLLVARQMLRCANLGEAMRLGCSLYRLVLDDFAPRLRVEGDTATLEIVDLTPPDRYRATGHLVLLYGAIGLMSWMVQRPIALREVTLPVSYPDLAPADTLFEAPLRRGTPSRIAFDARWLEARLVADMQGLKIFILHWPLRRVAPYSEDVPLALQVRRCLRRWDIAQLPGLNALAATMGQTAKVLRRRLHEEGQSYRAIVDSLRRDTAMRLLNQPQLSVAEVGYRLGFSEPSAFHRAFKRATGMTPLAYRRLRTGPALS